MSKKDAADLMQMIATVLDGVLNKDTSDNKYGFCLLVFEKEGETGSRTNYVSNCERKDILAALKEVTGRFEGQPQQSGRA
ncbi:hypothetical protein [Rhizobium leguminosarum]|uniref:hypothetical protein n=1 Tax=Rhizobium leguminosarum TaxID=384 RepID=UPI001617F52C|nr:hypothetical protein [Rhizobium leguminosarum]MBB4342128.1 hypothetical protein [Rhizobium leguminosarum]MBB6294752.1 hypothetical protein [Rhizobium leguminosarum]